MASLASSVINADSVHALLSQPDGRDKVLRLIQYVCKMLRWLDKPLHKSTTELSETAAAIEGALGTSRQAGRLFKWASMYVKLKGRQEFRYGLLSIPRTSRREDILSLIADLAMFSYYITDNLTFSSKLGVIQADTPKLSRRGARLWLTSIIAAMSLSLLRIYSMNQRIQALKKMRIERLARQRSTKDSANDSDGDGDNEREEYDDGNVESDIEIRNELNQLRGSRRNRALTAARQVCDLTVACNGSFDVGLHQSFVGLCGTISSAIGLFQIWPSNN